MAIGRFTAGQDGAIEVDAGGLPGRHRRAGAGRVILAAEILAGRRVGIRIAVTIHVSETTLAIELDDGETRVVRRTTTLPLRNINADRPRTVPSIS